MNIELHIERLVLDGFTMDPRNRAEVQTAVEEELTRLLMTRGLSAELLSAGSVRSIGAGEINTTNQTSPTQLGNHVAQAVHNRLGNASVPHNTRTV